MEKLTDKNVPIYIQIMNSMKHAIVSGELKTGDKVQSVREMAQELGVNPNTIQRALLELEREGLLETERAQGRYVLADAETIEALRREMAAEAAETFLSEMKALGIEGEEIKKYIK